jgi:hypothetical protein
MRQQGYGSEDSIDTWTLTPEDYALVAGKSRANRLAFAYARSIEEGLSEFFYTTELPEIVAIANSDGGIIVFGLDSNGQPVSRSLDAVARVDPADSCANRDPKVLRAVGIFVSHLASDRQCGCSVCSVSSIESSNVCLWRASRFLFGSN